MKEPIESFDGSCPSCSSDDWKLARVIVSSGTTIVESESEGGGWGVGVQQGGGFGLNYQGVNLDTKGTFTTVDAAIYAAPQLPDQYDKKHSLLQSRKDQLSSATNCMQKLHDFASRLDSVTPGFCSPDFFETRRNAYDNSVKKLESFQEYEVNKALWDKMRVCSRCGESFVTANDRQQANAYKITFPKFSFEGQERQCPNCKTYGWKTADAFFKIKILELESEFEAAKKTLEDAVNFTNKPQKPGFLNQLWSKVEIAFTVTPDQAQKRVNTAKVKLGIILKRQEEAIQQYPDLSKVRVCVNCKKLYLLDNDF